jgi:hypothetical protein
MPYAIFFHYGFAAIQGTNDGSRLGGPALHGCVRLHPSHAAALLALVERNGPRKTRIEIFNQARRRFNGLITLSIIDEISCADRETRAFIVQSRRRSDIRRRS